MRGKEILLHWGQQTPPPAQDDRSSTQLKDPFVTNDADDAILRVIGNRCREASHRNGSDRVWIGVYSRPGLAETMQSPYRNVADVLGWALFWVRANESLPALKEDAERKRRSPQTSYREAMQQGRSSRRSAAL